MKIDSSKVKHYIIERILWPLNLWGARITGVDDLGNVILKLNKETTLGKKGDLIYVPEDGQILNNIKKYSVWAGEEVDFLTSRYGEILLKYPEEKITFIDAGAHCGLVTRQFILNTGFKGRATLVEPVPQHVVAIRKNMGSIGNPSNFEIIEAALGRTEGDSKIYKESNNSGNSSLLRSLAPVANSTEVDVKVIASEDFSNTFGQETEVILLKCDLQGFDAQVLANFSDLFWQKLDSAVIEVLADPSIETKDVDIIIEKLNRFSYKSWKPGQKSLSNSAEIGEFWLSKSGLQRNLYVSK
jgi:FkbM family methyltransferase